MPAVTGYYGDESHDALIREITEIHDYQFQQLGPTFNKMVGFNKLYLANRPDRRLKHEQWRSWTFVPYPYVLTETKLASLCDILNSSDPTIQAEGIGPEDEKLAKKAQAHLSYVQSKNRWTFLQEQFLREASIQGTAVLKPIWRDIARQVIVRPTPASMAEFDQAINQAVKMGAPQPWADPAQDPAGFEDWRVNVNRSRLYGQIPEPPKIGPQTITEYRGPWYDMPAVWDLRFDPLIENWQDQPQIIHRIVKTTDWLTSRTGDREDQPYDPKQVEEAFANMGESRFSKWELEIAEVLGISARGDDPMYQKSVELWEVWRPGTPAPYCVVLNRKAIINKRPDVLPYWHGQAPFIPIRNVPLKRRALGLSDYQQTERLFHDINTFRDLRLDALVLSVLPIYLKLKTLGLPDMQRFLRPGMVLDAMDPKGLNLVSAQMSPGLAETLREEGIFKADIDDSAATGPNVRGQTSAIGRVSATESQSRLQQALLRQKQHVMRIEDELSPLILQTLFLQYQKGPEMVKVKVGGADVGTADAFIELTRDTFLEAAQLDLKFRGATKALNRELSAQQLKDFLQMAVAIEIAPGYKALFPEEIRTLLSKIYETLGQKGTASVVSDSRTKELQDAIKPTQIATAMQIAASTRAAQLMQMNGGAPLAPPMVGEPGGAAPPQTGEPPIA